MLVSPGIALSARYRGAGGGTRKSCIFRAQTFGTIKRVAPAGCDHNNWRKRGQVRRRANRVRRDGTTSTERLRIANARAMMADGSSIQTWISKTPKWTCCVARDGGGGGTKKSFSVGPGGCKIAASWGIWQKSTRGTGQIGDGGVFEGWGDITAAGPASPVCVRLVSSRLLDLLDVRQLIYRERSALFGMRTQEKSTMRPTN